MAKFCQITLFEHFFQVLADLQNKVLIAIFISGSFCIIYEFLMEALLSFALLMQTKAISQQQKTKIATFLHILPPVRKKIKVLMGAAGKPGSVLRQPFIWIRNRFLIRSTYPGLLWAGARPCLVFLLVGFAFAVGISTDAVSSYLTISPLLRFYPQRYDFCGTFQVLRPAPVRSHHACWSPDFPLC